MGLVVPGRWRAGRCFHLTKRESDQLDISNIVLLLLLWTAALTCLCDALQSANDRFILPVHTIGFLKMYTFYYCLIATGSLHCDCSFMMQESKWLPHRRTQELQLPLGLPALFSDQWNCASCEQCAAVKGTSVMWKLSSSHLLHFVKIHYNQEHIST